MPNSRCAFSWSLQISYNGQPLVKVACGAEFSMVVDCKGNLYSFGCPEYGQLGMLINVKVHLFMDEVHLFCMIALSTSVL